MLGGRRQRGRDAMREEQPGPGAPRHERGWRRPSPGVPGILTRVNPFFSNEKPGRRSLSGPSSIVSADLLKAFDDTRPERHGLIRWWCISSARAGLIRTIVTGTAHQPVARWRAPTEVFALMFWSRSTSGDFGKLISKSLERANRESASRNPSQVKSSQVGRVKSSLLCMDSV